MAQAGNDVCADVCADLQLYLDDEMPSAERAAVATHLDCCCDCAEAFRFEAHVRVIVARCCEEPVPESLRVRVIQAIYTAKP